MMRHGIQLEATAIAIELLLLADSLPVENYSKTFILLRGYLAL